MDEELHGVALLSTPSSLNDTALSAQRLFDLLKHKKKCRWEGGVLALQFSNKQIKPKDFFSTHSWGLVAECQREKRCYWVSQSHKLQVGLSPPQPHLIHLFDFNVSSSFPTKPSTTFILLVFKMNTWQQISLKYIQPGHPKLCCSPDISFTCPFNKGSDAYRSALHLSSARRHSLPFLRNKLNIFPV